MAHDAQQTTPPSGGLHTPADTLRRWRWGSPSESSCAPVRCRREQWYLLRGFPSNGFEDDVADLHICFLNGEDVILERRVTLSALADAPAGEALLGWVKSPEKATHLRVRIPRSKSLNGFDRLLLHSVAERDPKCHPLANVPRWRVYRPPFPIQRVVLPDSLENLRDHVGDANVEFIHRPSSRRKLAASVAGAACVIDPHWVRALDLKLSDLEAIAAAAWLIVDLETLAGLLTADGVAAVRTVCHQSQHEISSARVEYADVPTRGFALQDMLPYSFITGNDTFGTRVLRATGVWKRYADRTGFATLLSSETPWEKKCGDVLSAARPIGRGELIATDLPWLVAGERGRLLAPRLAEHLLRMHLAQPLADSVQYWNRWDECRVVVRDIGEMPRRYPPLKAVRWASPQQGVAALGIALPSASESHATCHLLIRTGRIDQLDEHDGVPPEPMVIFMKWLARELREQTRWATRHLAHTRVTWQFDTADGLKYVLMYESASSLMPSPSETRLTIRTRADGFTRPRKLDTNGQVWSTNVPPAAGVFGDGSLAYQSDLTNRLRRWIEQVSAAKQA